MDLPGPAAALLVIFGGNYGKGNFGLGNLGFGASIQDPATRTAQRHISDMKSRSQDV